jgi:hypothetical protein
MKQYKTADFRALLPALKEAFRTLEKKVPPPAIMPLPTPDGLQLFPRYQQRTAQAAALQKVARYISGLHAILVLLEHRLLQEDGTVKRILDELGERYNVLDHRAED